MSVSGGGEMIFQATHQQVLDGTKTQTRRPIKTRPIIHYEYALDSKGLPNGLGEPIDAVYFPNCRLKWQVGKAYAVQPGRGKKAVGRIRITKIRRERLQEIKPFDCRAEMGVSNDDPKRFAIYLLPRFIKLWNSLYRKPYRWEDNPEVWVLEFERVETCDATLD